MSMRLHQHERKVREQQERISELKQQLENCHKLIKEQSSGIKQQAQELAALRQLPEKWQRQRSSRITPDYEGDVWAALNKEVE